MAPYHLVRLVLILLTFPLLGIQLQDVLTNVPPELLDRFNTAVEDCVAVATLVSVVFDPCDPAYQRYFPRSDAAFVQQVFRRIANIPPDAVLSPTDYVSIMQHRASIGLDRRFVNLTINYDNHPQGAVRFCGGTVNAQGFFTTLVSSGAPCVCICPLSFQKYPDFAEIFDPPAWAKDAGGNSLPGYGCDGLGDHDSDLMWFVGAVLMHEVLHSPDLFNDIPQYDNLIGFHGTIRGIYDYPGPTPPEGYGPFFARVLQYLSTINPTQYGPHEAVNNADSYVAYALSVWWRWRCQRSFRESVTVKDNWNRLPPPRPP